MKPDLKKAFPSEVSPMVHARVTNALREVESMDMKKTRPAAGLALAIILTLTVLGGAAALVGSGVLDFVFDRDTPTQRQTEMVQPVGVTHEGEAATVSVTDAMFDGESLSLGVTFRLKQGERPVFVLINHLTLNGAPLLRETGNIEKMWLCDPFAPEAGDVVRGLTARLDDGDTALRQVNELARSLCLETGKAEVSLGLTLLCPKDEAVGVGTDLSYGEMQQRVTELSRQGKTPVWDDEGNLILTCNLDWIEAEKEQSISETEGYARFAAMEMLDAFTLEFALDASEEKLGAQRELATRQGKLCDGRSTITFEKVLVTELGVSIRLSILPEPPFTTAEDVRERYSFFTFCTLDRQPLSFQNTFLDGGSWLEEMPDGTQRLVVEYELPALTETPEALLMAPYDLESGPENPRWDDAIVVMLQ